jgi:type II secretory pathway pseudopilin PulG
MIELMFVVAVIGILATLAVVAYTRNVRKAHATEVVEMFAELKAREDMYHAEYGKYLAACPSPSAGVCTEGHYWPDPLPGAGAQMDATSPPATWQTLKVTLPKGGLYCQYEVIAGLAGDDSAMGTHGQMMFVASDGTTYQTPTRHWYYLMAQCDWDGDPTVKAQYWQRDDLSELGRANEGK